MSLQDFIEETVGNNDEELERIRELCEILNQLNDKESKIYRVYVTSDL